MNENINYRPCVGIALFNSENQIFVGERINMPNAWQMPQGGIDKGETILCAALRELKEETGISNAEIIQIADQKLRYILPENKIPKSWGGKYQGQEQAWVAMRFTGKDHDINLNFFDPPEFMRWQWVDLNKITEITVSFKRDLYQDVINMFKNL